MTGHLPHHHSSLQDPDKKEIRSGKMLASVLLNGSITLVQIAGGVISGSLALISDAIHNLGDTLAILLSYVALRLAGKPSDTKKTFGYKRVEILVALFNGVVLIGISFFLFFEAWKRFYDPHPIKGMIMLWVAVLGLLANLVAVVLLRRDAHHNLNIKAAYLHLLGDTLSSLGVIAGAILIAFLEVYWLDPLLTVGIGLFIIREAWSVIRDTVNILMEGSPPDIDPLELRKEMEKHPGVANVHHIHLWQLSDRQVHFECHADLKEDMPLSQADRVRGELEKMLRSSFRIHHVTIQMEYDACGKKDAIFRQ